MSTHHSKTLNRAIHPHFTTKYTREVNTFFNKIFPKLFRQCESKHHVLMFFLFGINDIDPFNNSFSFFYNPHMYFFKVIRYTATLWEWVRALLDILNEVSIVDEHWTWVGLDPD